MTRLKVAIVQEYIPNYRLNFFSSLADRLSKSNIDIVVVAGTPTGAYASRRDVASQAPWLRHAEPSGIKLRPIAAPFYGSARHWRDCEGVIFSLLGNSFDLNAELFRRLYSRRRIATWGHVKAYVKDANAVDMAIERHQMRLSDHLFAYTKSGADYAIKAGVDPDDVTAVMNSTDVSEMLTQSELMESTVVDDFRQRYNLTRGKTFGYIGGVDAVKRIGFLVDALDILWEIDRQVRLVVGGRGDQEHLLTSAVKRGQVVPLGYAGLKEKALINHVSEALLNPGRIGLLAVECMAMGMPILTTNWKYHGPEYEYLTEGEDVFVSLGGPERFADLVLNHTTDSGGSCRPQPKPYPTLDSMADNFANGVLKMMS